MDRQTPDSLWSYGQNIILTAEHTELDSNKPGIAEIATLPTVRRRAVSVQGGVEWGATAAVSV